MSFAPTFMQVASVSGLALISLIGYSYLNSFTNTLVFSLGAETTGSEDEDRKRRKPKCGMCGACPECGFVG